MAFQTTERITESQLSFLEYAQQQLDPDSIHEAAELWVDNPGERISRQMDELAQLYSGRTDRDTYHWTNAVDEYNSFATRTASGKVLEETYTIHDTFSNNIANYQSREYIASVLGEDGYRIHVLPDQSVRVYTHPGREQDWIRDETESDDKIRDFFYRSLIATVRTTDRDEQARADADKDALSKLETHMYGGLKRTAGLE